MPFSPGGGPRNPIPPNQTHQCWWANGWHDTYPHPVVATILRKAGRVALVKRSENDPTEPGKLVFPGGYLQQGETLAQAAAKEAREETGHVVVPGTLRWFATMDGPPDLPGRTNEAEQNVVHVYTAQAGEQVQEPDDEVQGCLWVPPNDLPPRELWGFGHFDITGMWLRHRAHPHSSLPIVPSGMTREELFLPTWRLANDPV